jgi:hypothetical protein
VAEKKAWSFKLDDLRVRDMQALQKNDLEAQAEVMARIVDSGPVEAVGVAETYLNMKWTDYKALQTALLVEVGKTGSA